jgi:hypothetical protein
MANRSIKIREWCSRLERYRRSGSTLAQFCREEQVSVPSFYYWRDRLASMHIDKSDTAAIPDSTSSSASSSSCLRFTFHAGNVRIECQADSMHAIDSVLAWASRNQESKFQQVIVQG